MSGNGLRAALLKEKPNQILRQLRRSDSYGQAIAKEIDCTYAHAIKIIDRFEEKGLVSFRKEGRKKIVSLTEKGEKVAEAAAEYMQLLEELDGDRALQSNQLG